MTRKPGNRKKRKPSFYVGKVISYVVLSLFALLFLVPFLYAVIISFTSYKTYLNQGFSWIPNPVDIGNYVKFFKENNFFRAFLNTLCYILPPILVGVFTSAMAAYSFARIPFKGKKAVFGALLSTVVVPGIITLVPSYLLFTKVYHWADTPWPIIVPGMFGSALTMFFLYQFIRTLPKELEEAAMIDGMTRFGVFLKIVLPLSAPALITQVILSFNGCYNDYLGPLLYLGSSPNLFTVQLLISSLQSSTSTNYPLMMAGAVVALVPTLILYLCCQKYFVEGISMTGLK